MQNSIIGGSPARDRKRDRSVIKIIKATYATIYICMTGSNRDGYDTRYPCSRDPGLWVPKFQEVREMS